MSSNDEQPPHRLFAAIVLMGSSLAVGCGGISEGEGPVSAAGHANVATGGTSSVGGGASVGAATSTGGSLNVGDTPSISIGGGMPEPAPVEPGPFKCPPEQWSCASHQCDHSNDSGWVLPDDCDCDPTKPLSARDCQAGEVFVCQQATSTADGRRLTKSVSLSCACVPKAMPFCSTECDTAFGGKRLRCFGSDDELSASCGCAIVLLK